MKDATLNKIAMWHKVRELNSNLNKTQIGKLLGIHRDTVRSYLSMSLDEFMSSGICNRKYKKKLSPYKDFIYKELNHVNFLSSLQIHDRLKENFPDLIEVSERTVYNYVEYIRDMYNIPKKAEDLPRQTQQIPASAYGKSAQVDFGERLILNQNSKHIRVYFFAMVLCRSRQKFIYFQTSPFTSKSTIYAHSLAFKFFGDLTPHEIIYDQDKVLIKSENLGDYLLTSEFDAFVKQNEFKITFCRKSDPQSKGKVENVVKYVKENFLKGRVYHGIESLNEEAIAWLNRTGNGKRHASTRLIPSEEFKIESAYMLPFKGDAEKPEDKLKAYTVRKDNTIAYRVCFYTLPLGSYRFSGCKVLVGSNDNILQIYDQDTGKLIASHEISQTRGLLIQNTSHRRNNSVSLKEMEQKVLELFEYDSKAALYLQLLHRDKPRYFRDNLQVILKNLPQYPISIRKDAIYKCIDTQVYHAGLMSEIAKTLSVKQQIDLPVLTEMNYNNLKDASLYDIPVDKSKLSTYQKVISQ